VKKGDSGEENREKEVFSNFISRWALDVTDGIIGQKKSVTFAMSFRESDLATASGRARSPHRIAG